MGGVGANWMQLNIECVNLCSGSNSVNCYVSSDEGKGIHVTVILFIFFLDSVMSGVDKCSLYCHYNSLFALLLL